MLQLNRILQLRTNLNAPYGIILVDFNKTDKNDLINKSNIYCIDGDISKVWMVITAFIATSDGESHYVTYQNKKRHVTLKQLHMKKLKGMKS